MPPVVRHASAGELPSRCEATDIIGKPLGNLQQLRTILVGGELDLDARFAFDMSQKLERQSRALEKFDALADGSLSRCDRHWSHETLLKPPDQVAVIDWSIASRNRQETDPDVQFRTAVEATVTSENERDAGFIPQPVRDLIEYGKIYAGFCLTRQLMGIWRSGIRGHLVPQGLGGLDLGLFGSPWFGDGYQVPGTWTYCLSARSRIRFWRSSGPLMHRTGELARCEAERIRRNQLPVRALRPSP